MATQSPFSLLQDFLAKSPFPPIQPPAWAVAEVRQRVVLLLNHVLMQEAQAMSRLAQHRGQVMLVQWQSLSFKLEATPAGLLDLAAESARPDLTLTVTEATPLSLAQALLKGEKPAVRIDGDVQLAAEVSWLAEHVRWDMEEDLSRVLGDAPARVLTQMAIAAMAGLRQFVSRISGLIPGKAA